MVLVDLLYATVCEYSTIQLRCGTGTKIVIIKADFGRDKYSSVCGEYYYDGNCTSKDDTTQIMKDICGNKQNCDQFVNTDIFPDNCSGHTKILRVWYQCVGDGNRNYIKFII
jgi:hypothetical protein